MFATQWMYKYNHQPLNMALGGITPYSGWSWLLNLLYFWVQLLMGGYPVSSTRQRNTFERAVYKRRYVLHKWVDSVFLQHKSKIYGIVGAVANL
jgi:hypothetical protein